MQILKNTSIVLALLSTLGINIPVYSDEEIKDPLKLIEELCDKSYSDTFPSGDHGKFYCLDAYGHYCANRTEGVKIDCDIMDKLGVVNNCPVCKW